MAAYVARDEFETLPTDTVIVIRGGSANVRGPDHEVGDMIPDDFLLALGVARSWGDPRWRRMMRGIVQQALDDGDFDGILSEERVQ